MSRAYYNENDPNAAAWLRELIEQGHIADGDVDERSIKDVQPGDLNGYNQVHLFAGVGGWSRALRLAGWPDDRDVWTGSCPCQPYSAAGKLRGKRDPRHLWPEMRRLIEACRPARCFGEQVESKAGRRWYAGVRVDLAAMDYLAGAADLRAAGAGAPHIRQRVYWVAFSQMLGRQRGNGGARFLQAPVEPKRQGSAGGLDNGFSLGRIPRGNDHGEHVRQQSHANGNTGGMGYPDLRGRGQDHLAQQSGHPAPTARSWDAFDVVHCRDGKARRIEPGTFPLAHGVPGRVGLLRGYGNAIVPEIAAEFIQAASEAWAEVGGG